MDVEENVARHYTHGALQAAIDAALTAAGHDGVITADTLAPLDEFHVGGRQATVAFLPALPLAAGQRLIDVGSGLGGPSRVIAQTAGCTVEGIDLTAEYVAAATAIADRLGLGERVRYQVASAMALPFPDASFDGATMLHVGMNIADKAGLMAEIRRVLKPGGFFGIYDVMRAGVGSLTFPLPWASSAGESFVETPATYRRLLEAAGFTIRHERDRLDFAREWLRAGRERAAQGGGPPAIGLHVVLGPTATQKLGNLARAIGDGSVAPTEIVAVAD